VSNLALIPNDVLPPKLLASMVEDDEDMMLSCKKAKRMMEEKSVLVQFR